MQPLRKTSEVHRGFGRHLKIENVVSSSLTFLQKFRGIIGWDYNDLRSLDEFIENIEIDSVNKE